MNSSNQISFIYNSKHSSFVRHLYKEDIHKSMKKEIYGIYYRKIHIREE